MSALRKPQAPDTMTGGHRWDFMEKLLTSGIDLSSDAKLLLYVLVTHHGDERRVNPGLRRLAEMSSMSNGRCMAARDELIAAGLITCTLGSGTRSSEYHLVALDAWYAEWVAARTSVPDSSVSVPDSGSSVQPVETKPSEPSKPEKEGKPDLRIVPKQGWEALKFRAPKLLQDYWLPHVELVSEGSAGIRLKAKQSYQADRIRDELKPGGALHGVALAVGIDPERVVIDGPAHGAAPPRPAVVDLSKQGMDEQADRLEAASSGPIEPMPHAIGPNVSSLAAYRTRLQPPTDAVFRSEQGNPPDTEDPDGT
jgi:hypothetical protein